MSDQKMKSRISNYLMLIKRKPNKNTVVKYFHLDIDTNKFIVDGKLLKLLPLRYNSFSRKDEFYIQVDVDKEEVLYYAFDLENYLTSQRANEVEGKMEWAEMEMSIHNFFIMHIKELSNAAAPHIEAMGEDNTAIRPVNRPNYETQTSYPGSTYTPPSNYGSFGYNSPAYKEREAFYDKLNSFLKESKTSKAIDHIFVSIDKMCQDKKFEELDSLLRMINFDKLNVPAMLTILDTTKQADQQLKARKEFFEKVKTYVGKIKPARAAQVLRNLESNTV
jgi:hypothetical protein